MPVEIVTETRWVDFDKLNPAEPVETCSAPVCNLSEKEIEQL